MLLAAAATDGAICVAWSSPVTPNGERVGLHPIVVPLSHTLNVVQPSPVLAMAFLEAGG